MGPRKRSKPNPKVDTEPLSEDTSPPQGRELQTKDLIKPADAASVPQHKPESVEPANSLINGVNTVSTADGQLVQTETDYFLAPVKQNVVRQNMASRE